MAAALYPSTAMAAVMAALTLHAYDGLRQREIARAAGDLHLSQVQAALERLIERGLVTEERRPQYAIYRVNRGSLYYPAVARSALIDLDVPSQLAAFAPQLVVLTGSIVSGLATADSDLDVLVVSDAEPAAISAALAPLGERLGRVVDTAVFDPFTFATRRAAREPLLEHMLATGLVVAGSIDA